MSDDIQGVQEVINTLLNQPPTIDANDWPYRVDFLKFQRYGVWAEICRTCLNQTEDSIKKIWFLIEEANARRRLDSLAELTQAGVLLELAKKRIGGLSKKQASKELVNRLYELIGYHGGWTYGPIGNFALEAISHASSLEVAEKAKNERGILFAKYHIAYARLKQSIAVNQNIREKFAFFILAHDELFSCLTADDEEDKRWRLNLQFHFFFFQWLIQKEYPNSEEMRLLKEAIQESNREDMYGAWIVFRAISLLKTPQKALEKCQSIEQAKVGNYWYYLSQVVRAHVWYKLGKAREVANLCHQITKLKEVPSVHLTQAIIATDLWK